jgi:hypothetical protein
VCSCPCAAVAVCPARCTLSGEFELLSKAVGVSLVAFRLKLKTDDEGKAAELREAVRTAAVHFCTFLFSFYVFWLPGV